MRTNMRTIIIICLAVIALGAVVGAVILSSDTELSPAERDRAAYNAALLCYVETDQDDSVDAFNECYKPELRRIQALFLRQKQG